MRHIVAKEVRDLAPVAAVVAVAGFGIAWSVGISFDFVLPPLAFLCAACGAALGVTQGLLDRRRREDPFLLHRPVSALRIHALRGAAGAATAAVVGAICVARATTVDPSRIYTAAALPGTRPEDAVPAAPDLAGCLACIAAAVVFHAVTRMALSAQRLAAAAALLVVLPTTVLYALLSIETPSVPWLALAAVAGVATALSSLQLSARSA